MDKWVGWWVETERTRGFIRSFFRFFIPLFIRSPYPPTPPTRPKWQYRLMCGSILFLLCALVLLATASIIYGFNMAFPTFKW